MEGDYRWVINLGNSICGVSLLALPYCFSQCGVLLGCLLLAFSALLTVWSGHLLVDSIFATKTISYEGIAHNLYGHIGKLCIEIASIALLTGTCAAFFVIVADLAPMVVAWLTNVPASSQLRLVVLFALGAFVVFPLTLIRNLDSLSKISAVSMCFYIWLTAQLMVYAFQKISSDIGETHIHLWRWSGTFHVLPIYALAFSCHLQLMPITREIVGEIHEGSENDSIRMKTIVKLAVWMIAIVYGSVSLFGHLAFSATGVKGDILANFDDGIVAQATRCGFTMSVIVSFPFMVHPCRSTLYSLIYGKTEKYLPRSKHISVTFSIVLIAFLIAVYIPNVELVLSLTGAVCGAIICYIFPASAYLSSNNNNNVNNKWKAMTLLIMGIFLLTAGTMSTLLYAPSSSRHDDVVSKLAEKPLLLNKPGISKNDFKVTTEKILLNKVPEDDVKKKSIDKSLIKSLDTNGQDNAPINKDGVLKAGRVLNSQKEDIADQKAKPSNHSEEDTNKQNKVIISKDKNETTHQSPQHVVQSMVHSTAIPQQLVETHNVQSNWQHVPKSLHIDKSLYDPKQPVGESQQQQQQQQQQVGEPQQQQPVGKPQQQQQQVGEPQQQQPVGKPQQQQQPVGEPQQQRQHQQPVGEPQQPFGDPKQQQQQQQQQQPLLGDPQKQQQQPVKEPIQTDNSQQSFQNHYSQYNVVPHNR